MESYIINGGNRLNGSVKISSSKNAVLPMIAGAMLTDEEVIIKDCPKIFDVYSMVEILKKLGVKVVWQESNLIIKAENITRFTISKKLSQKLRTSVLIAGAMLSRCGKVNFYNPGGCNIGERPIDIHLSSLKSLGYSILEKDGRGLCCKKEKTIKDNIINFAFPSVGATENVILSTVLGGGEVLIKNVALEPEIDDFILFLNSMGAKIKRLGNEIKVTSVNKLHGTEYKPMPDRIEGGTFLVATAIAGGEVEIVKSNPHDISSLIDKLCDNGCKLKIKNDVIYIKSSKNKKAFNIITAPYPAFPTDMQPLITTLLSVSSGNSVVKENIFENRFAYVSELCKMGAKIKVLNNMAIICGADRLKGACVTSPDLRGGAALVLAGLNAEGITKVQNIEHVKRGYENFDKKLKSIGAQIKKISNDS